MGETALLYKEANVTSNIVHVYIHEPQRFSKTNEFVLVSHYPTLSHMIHYLTTPPIQTISCALEAFSTQGVGVRCDIENM